jgi:hypothetical protein
VHAKLKTAAGTRSAAKNPCGDQVNRDLHTSFKYHAYVLDLTLITLYNELLPWLNTHVGKILVDWDFYCTPSGLGVFGFRSKSQHALFTVTWC